MSRYNYIINYASILHCLQTGEHAACTCVLCEHAACTCVLCGHAPMHCVMRDGNNARSLNFRQQNSRLLFKDINKIKNGKEFSGKKQKENPVGEGKI